MMNLLIISKKPSVAMTKVQKPGEFEGPNAYLLTDSINRCDMWRIYRYNFQVATCGYSIKN